MRSIEFVEEYDALVRKSKFSDDDRILLLEYLRRTRIFQPDVVVKHGSHLLTNSWSRRKMGDEIWAVYEQLCVAALHLGMIGWSAHCVEKLTERFPTSKRVRRIYAQYREAVGEWAEAIKIYDEIIKEAPETTFARKRKIAIFKQKGETQKAIEACNEYLESFSTDKEVWHELAEMYMEGGNLGRAAFCFEDLLMTDPRNLYVVLTYAELLFSQGEFENARKYFCLACDVDERNIRGLWGLAMVNQQLVKRDQSSEKMQQLQGFTIKRLKAIYNKSKHLMSSQIALEMLEDMSEAEKTQK